MKTLTVAIWNILYDKRGFFNTEPQAERQESIIKTLASLGIEFDAIGLLEVENSRQAGHHGKNIARHIAGVDGHWATSPDGRDDIGIFGEKVNNVTVHALAGGRTLMVTHIESIAVGLTHFTFQPTSDKLRQEQARQAIHHMAGYDKAVLMGDFNSASWQRSRKIIEAAGFSSVFQMLGKRRPPTIMPEKYRSRMSTTFRIATKYGLSPDDIYIRGIDVKDAGVFEGDSDHRGVWARLEDTR